MISVSEVKVVLIGSIGPPNIIFPAVTVRVLIVPGLRVLIAPRDAVPPEVLIVIFSLAVPSKTLNEKFPPFVVTYRSLLFPKIIPVVNEIGPSNEVTLVWGLLLKSTSFVARITLRIGAISTLYNFMTDSLTLAGHEVAQR